MARNNDQYQEELKEEVRQYYLDCKVKPDIAQLAKNSAKIFNRNIPEETMKDWKRYDPIGDWEHIWDMLHPSDTDEEMEHLIKRIYGIAVDPRTPVAVVAPAAKTYLELREKYNPNKGTSAKTSPDKAEQIAKKVLKELKEGKF